MKLSDYFWGFYFDIKPFGIVILSVVSRHNLFWMDMSSSCCGRRVTLRNGFSAQPLYSICLQSGIKEGNTAAWALSGHSPTLWYCTISSQCLRRQNAQAAGVWCSDIFRFIFTFCFRSVICEQGYINQWRSLYSWHVMIRCSLEKINNMIWQNTYWGTLLLLDFRGK